MTQTELINYLHTELNTQRTFYMWTIGTLITIIIFAVGFNFWQQNKFSDKKIESLKDDLVANTKDEIQHAQLSIDNIMNFVDKFDKQNTDIVILQAGVTAQLFATKAEQEDSYYFNQMVATYLLLQRIPDIKTLNADYLKNITVGLKNGFAALNKNKSFSFNTPKMKENYIGVLESIQNIMQQDNIKKILEEKDKDYYDHFIKTIKKNISIASNVEIEKITS